MTSPSKTGLSTLSSKGKQGGSRLSNGYNGGGIKRAGGVIYLPRQQTTMFLPSIKNVEPSIKKYVDGTIEARSSSRTCSVSNVVDDRNKVGSNNHWCPLDDGIVLDSSSSSLSELGVIKHQGKHMMKDKTFDECIDMVLYGKGKSSLPVFEELCRE